VKVLIADASIPSGDAPARRRHEVVVRTGSRGPLAEALKGFDALLVRARPRSRAKSCGPRRRSARGPRRFRARQRRRAAARERKVRVANTPAANAVSVAELVFGS